MMLKTFVALTLLVGVALGEYTSPVFLWGVNSPALPSLQTVPQDDFANLIAPLLKTHSLVVFQEEHLSSKDFLCHKATAGAESCYAHLQGFSPKTYYASVQNPSEALRALTKSREYNIVDETGDLQAPLECEVGKITFVSFDDIDGDDNNRANTLEAHDAAIAKIAKNLSNCKVAYLYMSTATNSKSRSKRATAAPEGGLLFRADNQFLIFFTSMEYKNGQKDSKFENVMVSGMTVTNKSATQFGVSMATNGKTPLTFNITYTNDGYYTLSDIQFENQEFYTKGINAPTTFSYSCGNLTVNTIPAPIEGALPIAYLKFNSLQFQAPFSAKVKNDFVFGDSWDCTPFFTPGILMGLFVSILFLFITFTGICWLVDINTMDRFDDPKGKTITINANE